MPFTHRVQEASSVTLVFEPESKIIGITHDDHIARGLPLSPAFSPEVETIVQVDVSQEW
jgi:hypothetical protein